MVHGSDSKLFYEPQTVLTPENAELVQKSQANLSNIVRVFSNELVAERARVQAIRKLSDDLGKALLFLSAIQFGLLVIWRPQITVALLGKGPDVE